MAKFKVGDKVAYPNHGVCIIKNLLTEQIEGQEYTFYELKDLVNGSKVKVPIEKAEDNGMRRILPEEGVEQVYAVLRDRNTPADKQTWNRRYREYMSKIKTGDPLEVAAVLRDLSLLKSEKQLSFGERKMYDQAHSLIVQELAVARDVDEQEIKSEIDAVFAS